MLPHKHLDLLESTMEFMQSHEEMEHAFTLICVFFTAMAVFASYVLTLR